MVQLTPEDEALCYAQQEVYEDTIDYPEDLEEAEARFNRIYEQKLEELKYNK